MNIETIVIKYLSDSIPNARVYAEVPEKPSGEFYVIDKTGGSVLNRVTTSTIAVQSYGSSKLNAAQMNETVKQAMENIVTLPEIGGCHLNSDYNFTNTGKRQHRYQAVFDITHY